MYIKKWQTRWTTRASLQGVGNEGQERLAVNSCEAFVPLRWARRGWPGAPGSGCSCRCGGRRAGKPGRSLTWSSSPCQWGRAPRWCQGWHWKSCSSAGLADRRNTGRCKQKPSLLWSGCVARSTQTPQEKIKPAGGRWRGRRCDVGHVPYIVFLALMIWLHFQHKRILFAWAIIWLQWCIVWLQWHVVDYQHGWVLMQHIIITCQTKLHVNTFHSCIILSYDKNKFMLALFWWSGRYGRKLLRLQ